MSRDNNKDNKRFGANNDALFKASNLSANKLLVTTTVFCLDSIQ